MYQIEDLINIVKQMRAPDGCPWDSVQTHESLTPCMINETAEALAAVEVWRRTDDSANLREELGDMLFLILLQCEIAREEGVFDFSDVVQAISEKMVRRHPHVFAKEEGQAVPDWNEIKKAEKASVPERIEAEKKRALCKVQKDMIEHLSR